MSNNNDNENSGDSRFAGKGHIYERIGDDVKRIVQRLEDHHGHSLGQTKEVLKLIYPRGIAPDQFGDAVQMVRVLDELFVIGNMEGVHDSERADMWKELIAKVFTSLGSDTINAE